MIALLFRVIDRWGFVRQLMYACKVGQHYFKLPAKTKFFSPLAYHCWHIFRGIYRGTVAANILRTIGRVLSRTKRGLFSRMFIEHDDAEARPGLIGRAHFCAGPLIENFVREN